MDTDKRMVLEDAAGYVSGVRMPHYQQLLGVQQIGRDCELACPEVVNAVE